MSAEDKHIARKEIHGTLRICNFCIGSIGISMTEDISNHFGGRLRTYFALCMTSTFLVFVVVGQYSYIVGQMRTQDVIEGLIGSNLHTAGYGFMSLAKLITIWIKRHKFRQLVEELADIWPVSVKEENVADIKRERLSTLRNSQIMYTFWNALGVWLFNLTPIAEFIYHNIRGLPAELGYVYLVIYPFDKTKPIYHGVAYIFESCAGTLSVCIMLGTDLLFMTMTSHIGMLLRLLQLKIRNLINDDDVRTDTGTLDCYGEIVNVVKIHQRLIHYNDLCGAVGECPPETQKVAGSTPPHYLQIFVWSGCFLCMIYINDLEEAFSAANLINVVISSINICCCAFNIVFLDSWMEMSNKFFLCAALTQMGIVCWYADDIFRVSVGVSDAVYESGWYRTNVRCRRALLVVLQRSQKPLYFTALKFSPITMATYSSVLTTSYSYFTLLYTSFKD